jgi:hypothetical protein
MKLFLALAAAALVLLARDAAACSVCGCGDPLVDVGDSVPMATTLRLALDFEWLSASAAVEGDAAARESVTQQTLRPVVVYSPAPSVNLVLQVPFVRKDWAQTGGADAASATTLGLGDVDLGGRWHFWETRDLEEGSRQSLAVSGGMTFPTGADDAAENGARLDDHAQLGTGTFGPYLGLVYAYHRDPWNLFTSVTGQLHGTSSFGYHFGGALRFGVRLDYRVEDGFALEAGVDGRQAGRDRADDVDVANTGGLVLSLAPGLAVNLFGDVWLRARLQVPVVTALDGDQSVGLTAFASVQLRAL